MYTIGADKSILNVHLVIFDIHNNDLMPVTKRKTTVKNIYIISLLLSSKPDPNYKV